MLRGSSSVSRFVGVVLVLVIAATMAAGAGSGTRTPRFYLVRIDADSGHVTRQVNAPNAELLQTTDGRAAWQMQSRPGLGGEVLTARNPRTGTVERRIVTRRGVSIASVQVGFGSVWDLWQGIGETKIDRFDAHTGRKLATITLPQGGQPAAGAALFTSARRIWALDTDDKLAPIDPSSNRVGLPIPTHMLVGDVHELGHDLWVIPQLPAGYVQRINMQTQQRTTYPLGVRPALESHAGTWIWFITFGRTRNLIAFDVRTGRASKVVALNGAPSDLWAGSGKVWVAAGPVVDVVDTAGGQQRSIRLRHGLCAFAVTGDPLTHSVWLLSEVASCDRR